MTSPAVDVLVLGEVLVEISSTSTWADGATARLGFSGDALNVAAASAAAGARTALVARVPDDDLGDALVARAAELGIDVRHVVRVPGGQHGVYLSHADPHGRRQFAYARAGSAGSRLSPADLDDALLRGAGVVVASGILAAVSDSGARTVVHAARRATRFVFDPNWRPRLTSASAAAALLHEVAPLAAVVTPSWPTETSALLGLPERLPATEAATAVLDLGCGAVVLTCGADGAVVAHGDRIEVVPPVPPPAVVDQTGAGDALTGTVCARLALGDDLVDAVRLGGAAASLAVQGVGGTGYVAGLDESLRALAAADRARVESRARRAGLRPVATPNPGESP